MGTSARFYQPTVIAEAPEPTLPWVAQEHGAVPGREGVTVGLLLDQEGRIFVERPDIFVEGVPEGGETYLWPLSVPHPTRGGVPSGGMEPIAGYDDVGRTQPIHSAAAVGRPRGRLDAALRTACTAAWKELWKRFAVHLEPKAATLASQHGYSALVYSLLARRPDLLDHVRIAPGLAPFYTLEALEGVPPTGWNLNMIMTHLVPPSFRGVTEGESASAKLPPGAAAWMKHMSWDKAHHPAMPKEPADWAKEARRLVRQACERARILDPNRIHQIKEPAEWLLVNMTLGHPGTGDIAQAVLLNLPASLRAVDMYLKEHPAAPEELADRIHMTLNDVIRWRVAMPDVASRVTGFKKMVEETVLWDRAMRAATLDRGDGIALLRAARMAAIDEAARQAVAASGLCREVARAARAPWTLQAGVDPSHAFEPVPHPVVEFGGFIMRHLPTPAALQWESLPQANKGMEHCVVTHVNSCMRGVAHVFTIRRPTPLPPDYHQEIERLRTAATTPGLTEEEQTARLTEWKLYELTQRDAPLATIEVDSQDFRSREFRGVRNQDPSDTVRRWTMIALQVARGAITVEAAEQQWNGLARRNGM